MLNLIACIICSLAVIAQWNDNWALVTVCALFALANGYISIPWLRKKLTELKYSWKHRHEDDF